MAASALIDLVHALLWITLALLLPLLVRLLVRRYFGPSLTYSLWLSAPLVTAAAFLPAPIATSEYAPQIATDWLPLIHIEWLQETPESGSGLSKWLLLIWFVGGAALLCVQLLRQWTYVRRLQPLHPGSQGVWTTSATGFSPAVIGAFPPRIVLPADFELRYTLEEQALVLAHERMHIQRYDPLVNSFLLVAQAALWFHPLIHIAAICLRNDQELACDAAIVGAQPTACAAYANAILKTQLATDSSPVSCSWKSRTASSLRRRILMLNRRSPSRSRRYAGLALISTTAIATAGLAWAVQPPTDPQQNNADRKTVTVVRELADSVQVSMSPDTRIAVDYSQAKRTVRAEHGATVSLATGDPRPLTVTASPESPPKTIDLKSLTLPKNGKPPLLLLDGKAQPASFDLQSIALSRIERIEVLPKDSATTATYGPKAENGVINIVLKH